MAKGSGKVAVKKGAASVPATAARDPFGGLRQEIDRLFEEFGPGFALVPSVRRLLELEPFRAMSSAFGAAAPAVDVADKDKEIQVTAELPGMDEKDIEVTLSGDMLTIKGEKKEEREEKERNYYFSERRFGSFQRSFRLPEGVNPDKVEARFDKGVLTVTLPKTAEAAKRQRKIAIKAA